MGKYFNIPSADELKELMKNPGQIKGTSFLGDIEYVREKKGEEGLKRVEEETKKLGFPIEYGKIKENDWYSIGLRLVSFTAILNTFGWGEKELAEIAQNSPKVSFIIRFFMKYFVSPEKIFRGAAGRIWKRYYSTGSLRAMDFFRDEKGGWAILRVERMKNHPMSCFFIGAFKLSEPRFMDINFEETKCTYRGDDCDEFLIKWTYKDNKNDKRF